MTGEKEPRRILKRLQAKYPNADFVLTYGERRLVCREMEKLCIVQRRK